jgi:hydroxyethylthiazole kinase-like uncharacterized protein yjeF
VIPIVTPQEMAAIDAAAPEPVEVLIGRAGRAVAGEAMTMLGGAYGRTVTVIAGRGNNGADGRVAGEVLRARGVRVRVIDAGDLPAVLPPCDLVVDAAYGTGFRGEWTAPGLAAPTPARGRARPPGRPLVLAVDIPSGVDALTGAAGPGVLHADRTITFQAYKPGLLFGRGRAVAGEVVVADIGLDTSVATRFLVDADAVARWLPRRPADVHKWKAAVRVVAGSAGMPGAARLCTAAAARTGASLVTLSSPGADPGPRDEIIHRGVAEGGFADEVLDDLSRFAALAVGPGLGRAEPTITAVRRLIAEAPVPLVLDGDGLFAAAWSTDGAVPLLRQRSMPTVLTPHDGEYAVLCGTPPGADRIDAARRLADDTGAVVLLKGPTTVVAAPDEPTYVIATGDQRLATAGTGDVLTGVIAALLAQGMDAAPAAATGAWLHAAASQRAPVRGMLAGDLVDLIPQVLPGPVS